ncbi:MAG: PKD domain-containing protein, partial [Candidatus Cloacimonadales bacterium]|nr:PKD domain-containing protein [Candidatus Cloacimonadales bacterium]
VTYDQQEFDLNAVGQTQEYSATFTLDPSWDLQDIKAVSFVQTWTGNKIILQACQTGFSGLMALFASDVTSGVRDLTVNFNDFSFPQDGVLEWQWDFDGDGVIDSYEQYPSYTYTEPGTYSVTLTISDGEETHTATNNDMITVYDTDNAQGVTQGVWRPENGIYRVVDDIIVPEGGLLEILPGTNIIFDENTKMTVNGTVIAVGDENNLIQFKSDDTWKGIIFEYSENDNQFAYCDFRKATGTALKIINSNATINSCKFLNNSGPATAGGVDIAGISNVEISNSFFANNKSSNNSGAIGIAGANVILKNNIIANNSGQNAGAVIVRNSGTVDLINNTIANNTANVSTGAQIINIGSTANIMNCIFYGDTDVLTLNGFSSFSYSRMVEPSTETGNIDDDPMFVNPSASAGFEIATQYSDWMLQENSPCIDAGNPNEQYNDTENPASPGNALYPALGTIRNDMGAFGGQSQFGGWVDSNDYTVVKPKDVSISAYPNPFNPNINIEFNRSSTNTESVQIDIYNIRGQKIQNLYDQNTNEKTIRLSWNGVDKNGKIMPSGIYFIKAGSDIELTTKKIILLK